MYMNKTLNLDIKNMAKVQPVFAGWNIAQWENPHISCNINFDDDYGEINVDNKIPHNQIKMILAEARVSFNKVSTRYYIEDLNGLGKSIANTLILLEELLLLDIIETHYTDNYIEIEVAFTNCELVEKVFKKFKIID